MNTRNEQDILHYRWLTLANNPMSDFFVLPGGRVYRKLIRHACNYGVTGVLEVYRNHEPDRFLVFEEGKITDRPLH